MINLDGATLVFPTSFGYFDPHMLAMAAKFPDVQFRHCGGMWNEGKHPMNTGSYFGYIGLGQYLNGIVAGHATQIEEDRLRGGQADPAGPAQHQLLPARRALGRPGDHLPGDLHRRVVAGGEGGGGHQRAGRPGRRRHHLPCRQPEGGGRDGGRPRRLHLRLPRQPEPARAREIPDRRRVELGQRLQDVRRQADRRRAAAQLHPRRPGRRLRQDEPARTGRRRGGAHAVRRARWPR